MSVEAWRSFKESNLRGLKETNLRALLVSKVLLSGCFASINTMGLAGGEIGYGGADVYPSPNGPGLLFPDMFRVPNVEPIFQDDETNPALNFDAGVKMNNPLQMNVGDIRDFGDPSNPGTLIANYWFNQSGAQVINWSPAVIPITQWTLGSTYQYPIMPSWLAPGNTAIIKGFAIWPTQVCTIERFPDNPFVTTAKCIGKARLGASISFCKAGITGTATLHNIVSRPIGRTDGGVLSAPLVGQSRNINILTDADILSMDYLQANDPEHIFICPAANVLCIWLGLDFGQVTALLPKDGSGNILPFDPMTYSLLSSYSPLFPPYP